MLQNGFPKMPDILIICPVTGQAVFTGLNTETVVFETLPAIEIPIKCPRCGQTHRWKPKDAWVSQPSDPTRH
ncbi:hypothetical protein ACVJ19_007403 [Bradyrhizobium sp. USDA 376]